mgnify:CR=1 FL=1
MSVRARWSARASRPASARALAGVLSPLTGWSRLHDRKHYLSQVILGWAIAWEASGAAVAAGADAVFTQPGWGRSGLDADEMLDYFRAVAEYANAGHAQVSELGIGYLDTYFTRLGEIANTLADMADRQRLEARLGAGDRARLDADGRVRFERSVGSARTRPGTRGDGTRGCRACRSLSNTWTRARQGWRQVMRGPAKRMMPRTASRCAGNDRSLATCSGVLTRR